MKTFEYLNQKIDVPETWDDVTLKTFESFYKDKPTNLREKLAVISKICNVDPSVLLDWPAEVLPLIVENCNFLWVEYIVPPSASIKIGDITYAISVEEKLSLGQYIDADEVQKEGENVLSNILAITCRPAGEPYDTDLTDERTEMFSSLSMAQVQPLLAFFLTCKNALEKRTTAFSNLMEAAALLPPSIQILQNLGGGIKLWQIWQTVRYGILTVLLRHRLRKLSRLCSTPGIKTTRKKRKDA